MPDLLLDYGRYTNEILGRMNRGTIRYWAAAREAAGVPEEPYEAATLAEALEKARSTRDLEFRRVLSRSSFLVDGAPVGTRPHEAVELPEDGVVEVLPPFAGG
jgi:molybdopterin synthase sulfur carrier subunit